MYFLTDPSVKRQRGTRPTGTYPPNAYGLYDMCGNVWEWVSDWYAADYYGSGQVTDPGGPGSGDMRIVRGGAWVNDDVSMLRCSHRHKVPPDTYAVQCGVQNHMLGMILSVLIGLTAAAQEPAAQPPVIVATGRAVVKRAPDVAFVSMTVESRAKSPRDAQRQNADAMAAVVRKMGELGIPKDGLRDHRPHLYEDVDNANGRRVSRGFVARNSVEVRIDDIARTGEIADAGVAAGATSIGGIRFDTQGARGC